MGFNRHTVTQSDSNWAVREADATQLLGSGRYPATNHLGYFPKQDSVKMDYSVSKSTGLENKRHCRLCHAPLVTTFVDLGMSPLCESFLTVDQLDQMEPYFPLHVLVCDECFLVQLQEYVKPEHIFTRIRIFFFVLDVLGRACAQVLST